jgi:hypothetical protein
MRARCCSLPRQARHRRRVMMRDRVSHPRARRLSCRPVAAVAGGLDAGGRLPRARPGRCGHRATGEKRPVGGERDRLARYLCRHPHGPGPRPLQLFCSLSLELLSPSAHSHQVSRNVACVRTPQNLQQRKFHVSIPFITSTAGYGFLFNMPGDTNHRSD